MSNNIVSTENSLGFSGAITAAQAINSHFGLQASVDGGMLWPSYEIEYGANETGTDSTRFIVGTGIAATADVMPYFPLGILVEYRFRSRFEETKWFETEDFGSANHIIGGGLFYTGNMPKRGMERRS